MDQFINEVDPALMILVSAFLPLVIAVINRYGWPTEAKALASFAVSIAVGVGVAWIQETWTREGVLISCAAVYGLSQAAYYGVLRPTGVADQVEKKTG